MPRIALLLLASLVLASSASNAQSQQSFGGSTQLHPNAYNNGGPTGPINPAQDFLLVAQPPLGNTYALHLGDFASAQDLASTNAAIGRNRVLMLQGVALASAFNVTPPNPGDRFSLNFGAAAFQGEAAGSVSVAWQVLPRAMLYTGVAQSSGQTVMKGGMSFSLQ